MEMFTQMQRIINTLEELGAEQEEFCEGAWPMQDSPVWQFVMQCNDWFLIEGEPFKEHGYRIEFVDFWIDTLTKTIGTTREEYTFKGMDFASNAAAFFYEANECLDWEVEKLVSQGLEVPTL